MILIPLRVLLLLAPLMLCLAVSPARAAPVTFDFSGQLFDVPARVSSAFSVGQAFSGLIVYDSTAPRIDAGNPNIGAYAYTSFTLTVGSLTLSAAGVPGVQQNVVNVFDNSGGFDILRVDGRDFSSSPATIAGQVVSEFNFQLTAAPDTFSAGILPTSIPPLSAFPVFKGIGVVFALPGEPLNRVGMRGTLDTLSVTVTDVPEPASLALLLGGVVMLGAVRQRRSACQATQDA